MLGVGERGGGECGGDSLTTVVVTGVGGGECGGDSLTTVVVTGVGGGECGGDSLTTVVVTGVGILTPYGGWMMEILTNC